MGTPEYLSHPNPVLVGTFFYYIVYYVPIFHQQQSLSHTLSNTLIGWNTHGPTTLCGPYSQSGV